VTVIQRFVAAARQRAGDRKPRIAFVTASGFDPFDAVDYYTSLFTEAGAVPVWWPLDAAVATLIAENADCADLAARQRVELGLPDRSVSFPDLVAEQQAWCRSERRDALPAGIHGVFFAGGDQWRLRRAFVNSDDQPYPWLIALRQATTQGDLVIGGTSAGTAVQSGAGMLSNGSPQQALRHGSRHAAPPEPGCSRSAACGGLDEDAFTTWPAGGFTLSGPFLMDTHFSERAREWRLLRALAEGPARVGLGVDETSAIHLRQRGQDWELEAVGASGGWLFEAAGRTCGELRGKAHYLSPGLRLRWSEADGLRPPSAVEGERRESAPMPALAMPDTDAQSDPFRSGAVRAAIAPIALGLPVWSIDAPGASLRLERSEQTAIWTGPGSQPGVTALDFTFRFRDACGEQESRHE
jgi:cyanophycinase-like exopeptidase